MLSRRCIQYLSLPKIPDDVLTSLPRDWRTVAGKVVHGSYRWTDQHNHDVNVWCQANICPDIWWAFQIMDGDVPLHRDDGTKTKFCYLLETGGEDVYTEFIDDDTTVIFRERIPAHQWHILQADVPHRVCNIQPGRLRVSITGRIFQ